MRALGQSMRKVAIAAAATLASSALAAPADAPKVIRDCPDCPDMVVIPPGSAILGSTAEERRRAGIVPIFGDREGPTYKVTFKRAYAIGRTEITRAQYRTFVEDTKRPDPTACGVHEPKGDTWGPQPGYNWRNPGFEQDDTHPAVCIGWGDAAAYAEWLSKKTGKLYRLPSDAEWEYAARGGTNTPWYFGDTPEVGCTAAQIMTSGTVEKFGWPKSIGNRFVCATARSFTVPVASFPPNPFGVYDMIGNAFEWAADCNAPDNTSAHTDGTARTTGDCARHYLKGGAFQTPYWLTRHAVRGAPLPVEVRMFAMGFRVARSLD